MQGTGGEAGYLHLIEYKVAAKESPPVWISRPFRGYIREVAELGGGDDEL
jgi:hypothetical protein